MSVRGEMCFYKRKTLYNLHSELGARLVERIFTRFILASPERWTATGIRCTSRWNYVELFWNSLDNAPLSIVFYLKMKVDVEVGVHDIRSRFTPLFFQKHF